MACFGCSCTCCYTNSTPINTFASSSYPSLPKRLHIDIMDRGAPVTSVPAMVERVADVFAATSPADVNRELPAGSTPTKLSPLHPSSTIEPLRQSGSLLNNPLFLLPPAVRSPSTPSSAHTPSQAPSPISPLPRDALSELTKKTASLTLHPFMFIEPEPVAVTPPLNAFPDTIWECIAEYHRDDTLSENDCLYAIENSTREGEFPYEKKACRAILNRTISVALTHFEMTVPVLAALLQSAPSLKTLTIRATRLDNQSLIPFQLAPALEQVKLLECQQLTQASLEHLSSCQKLQRIILSGATFFVINDAGKQFLTEGALNTMESLLLQLPSLFFIECNGIPFARPCPKSGTPLPDFVADPERITQVTVNQKTMKLRKIAEGPPEDSSSSSDAKEREDSPVDPAAIHDSAPSLPNSPSKSIAKTLNRASASASQPGAGAGPGAGPELGPHTTLT